MIACIDDAVLAGDAALVLLRHVAPGLQEKPRERLEHVGLVDDRHLPAVVLHGVVEGELEAAPGARARVHAGGHRHRVLVVADRDVVLESDVQALEVLAHEHEVDLLVAAGNERARGPEVRVELELLA